MNCTVRLLVGSLGGVLWCGRFLMHKRSGLSRALHWHLCCLHVQGKSHVGTVFSCGWLLNFPTFMRV